MALYWFLLLVPALGSVLAVGKIGPCPNNKAPAKTSSFALGMFAFLLVVVVGFRHKVGGDWFWYLELLGTALDQTWYEGMMNGGDPAYGLLTWIAANFGGGLYLVNLVCGLVFVAGLLVFARSSPQPWLAMCVAVPYLVIVVAMGYTRQSVAIGLAMVGLVGLSQGRIYKFAAWVILAALFHKSALILLPLAVFSGVAGGSIDVYAAAC